jgi:uncharacterized protein YeaO (DUF488 family)
VPARRAKAHRAYGSPACSAHELEPARATRRADIQIKRIYEPPDPADGYRALVDRLWPRGITRPRAALDNWLIDLAPSTELRKWFHQDPRRWTQFVRRYRAELRAQAPMLEALRQRARQQRVTLLYAARDPGRNHALVLREVLCTA